MNIKRLEYFIKVAELKSITKAAKSLHISQPPLSQQLKLLESELGVVLLNRSRHGITLTYAGERLYYRAKTITSYAENTILELQNISKGIEGCIQIGMTSSSGIAVLPHIISDFVEKFPLVKFDIHEKNTYELIDLLNNNIIDLAFVRTPFDSIASFHNIDIKRESLLAVGKNDFLNGFNGKQLPVDFFNEVPIVVYKRWYHILKNFFESYNVTPRYHCLNEDARTSLVWASAGGGVAIIPESITALQRLDDMFCLPITELTIDSTITAIWHKNSYLSSLLQNFIDILSTHQLKS